MNERADFVVCYTRREFTPAQKMGCCVRAYKDGSDLKSAHWTFRTNFVGFPKGPVWTTIFYNKSQIS